MTGYEQFLVVVLATSLAIFLILGIIVQVLLIKIFRSVKRITAKAEHLTEKAEAVGDFFAKASAPLAIARIVGVATDAIFRKGKKR